MREPFLGLCSRWAFVLASLFVVASRPTYADLKAHYRFDGDLNDATGQHHGRPVDPKVAPTLDWGVAGDALLIESANAGIEVTHPEAIDFSRDFTIAAWVSSCLDSGPYERVLRIGCRADNEAPYICGLLDELQIYDHALTAEDVQFLFTHPGSDSDSRQIVRPSRGCESIRATRGGRLSASSVSGSPKRWLPNLPVTNVPCRSIGWPATRTGKRSIARFCPFFSGEYLVTPVYWGCHWPLARGRTTGYAIVEFSGL